MLILAPCHSIKFTKLLNELVHCKHRRSKSLWFFINILCTLNDLVVQNLIGIDKISHFTAENCAVRNHLCWYSSLRRDDIFHFSYIFFLVLIFHDFLKFFDVIILEEFNQERIWLKLFSSAYSGKESSQILFSSFDGFLRLLFLLYWKWRHYHIGEKFNEHFPQEVKVLIFSIDWIRYWLCLNSK